jgi:hypothetical protein
MESKSRLAVLSGVLALLCAGCAGGDTINIAGDGDGGIVSPPVTDLAGEWGTTAVESYDTCGFDPPPAFEPAFIEEIGDDTLLMTFIAADGTCEESVRDRDGDIVTMTLTDVFDGGCGMVLLTTTVTYRFSGASFSGTADHRLELVSGFCANLPCDYSMAVTGSRCDGCWPGCVQPSPRSADTSIVRPSSDEKVSLAPVR